MNNALPACPCGSARQFAQCCEPLLRGAQTAETASQLMRSRYSAFATDTFDYLVRTHHPSQRAADERAQLESQANTLQWLALQLCDSSDGTAGQQHGEVEFKAFFRAAGNLRCLHERSRFVHENGQWFYLDAVFCREQRVDAGRNDACICGSGRKFKQCHGRT
jgi:SEC-C motif-containing protein